MDLSKMAKTIVEKCSLIHPGRVNEVEQSLFYLLERTRSEGSKSETLITMLR